MSVKLKDFIFAIRATKTPAEERAIVAKECAAIRSAFRDENSAYRHRNIAKLIFVSMLGHSVTFCQLECLKLIASTKFLEKRIGYLALTLFFDDQSEVLMLATNTIKNDLSKNNQQIACMALTALATIGSPDMCRTLVREIEDLMVVANPSIRKRAILCAAHAIKYSNDDLDVKFASLASRMLDDRNHGVLISTISFCRNLVECNPEVHGPEIAPYVQSLSRILKDLISSSPAAGFCNGSGIHGAPVPSATGRYSNYGTGLTLEYDYQGINDPILQVKILEFIRVVTEYYPQVFDDPDIWTVVHDVLSMALVPSDSQKYSALCSVLEAVKIVFALVAPSPPEPTTNYGAKNAGRHSAPILTTPPISLGSSMHSSEILAGRPGSSKNSSPLSLTEIARPARSQNAATLALTKRISKKLEGLEKLENSALRWLKTFLENATDNSVRYIGISLLDRIVAVEPQLAAKHQNTVLACISDPDTTIQRRAIRLADTLTTPENATLMIQKLMAYLRTLIGDRETGRAPVATTTTAAATPQKPIQKKDRSSTGNGDSPPSPMFDQMPNHSETTFKSELAGEVLEKIGRALMRFSPTRRWELDCGVHLLCLAGNHVNKTAKNFLASLLLASSVDLQRVAVYKLYYAMRNYRDQAALFDVGVWVFGEFCQILSHAGDGKLRVAKKAPATAALLDGDLLGGSETPHEAKGSETPRSVPDTAISVDDLIESIESVVAMLADSYCAVRDESLCSTWIDSAGILGPIGGGTIKCYPSTTSHFVEARVLSKCPELFLPTAFKLALKGLSVLETCAMALTKIGIKYPGKVDRILTITKKLQEPTSGSSEFVERIGLLNNMLSFAKTSHGRLSEFAAPCELPEQSEGLFLEILESRPEGDASLATIMEPFNLMSETPPASADKREDVADSKRGSLSPVKPKQLDMLSLDVEDSPPPASLQATLSVPNVPKKKIPSTDDLLCDLLCD